MATKHPRLNVAIEPKLYSLIHELSKKEGISMSHVARDLLREALLIYEDMYWAKEAEMREKTFMRKKPLEHADVWK